MVRRGREGYSKLKIVERPYAPPYAAVAVEAEDVLCCLGLHPHISASDWLVINLDEASELIELIRPVPVTGATSDGYHTFDERVYVLTGHGHCFADLPDHNTVEHFLIFQHDQEFFAVDDEMMVGPCSSRDESAHEFGCWKISREINRYNAMKEFLDDARRRD